MTIVIPQPHIADDMEAERLWQAFLSLFARVEKPAQGGGRS